MQENHFLVQVFHFPVKVFHFLIQENHFPALVLFVPNPYLTALGCNLLLLREYFTPYYDQGIYYVRSINDSGDIEIKKLLKQ